MVLSVVNKGNHAHDEGPKENTKKLLFDHDKPWPLGKGWGLLNGPCQTQCWHAH